MRFKDSPEQCPQGGVAPAPDKIMHASFRVGDIEVMASDGNCTGKPAFQGFSLALSVPNAAEAEKLFARITDGGTVQMPLGKTFFSPAFGMAADKFGMSWMVVADA